MRDPLTVTEEEVRGLREALKGLEDGGCLSKRQQARNVWKRGGEADHRLLEGF